MNSAFKFKWNALEFQNECFLLVQGKKEKKREKEETKFCKTRKKHIQKNTNNTKQLSVGVVWMLC